jgi:hypothetical protein
MALSQSREAIGVISQMLATQLQLATKDAVLVGRPEDAISGNAAGDKLNLFLYQIDFDGQLRNYPLDTGQSPPLWIVLRYLLTAFNGKDSDTADAHRLLGKGLTALQGLNFINSSDPFLKDNPEPLKVTFDSADVELLSKVMQGSDEKYRLSAAFQVRPVMLMVDEEPAYAPAIKTVGPPKPGVIPAEGEGVLVLPSLGPNISSMEPLSFEAGDSITIKGPDLNGVDKVHIGSAALAAEFSAEGHIAVIAPAAISAGSQSVTVSRLLPSGRRIFSSALLGRLLPTFSGATIGALQGPPGNQTRKLDLTGGRLGGPDDDVLVAFYKVNGEKVHLFEAAGAAAQTSLTITIPEDDFPDAGTYLVILRVNGVQATNSPELVWP